MKFEISKNLLDNTLQSVSKGLSTKTPMPILMGILLIAKENSITFITTNKEIAIRIILKESENLKIFENGSCVIPGKYLVDIVKRMDGEKIEITTFDEKAIKIISNNSDVTLNAYNRSSFPETNFDENSNSIRLSCKEIKQIVKQTSFACATSESRIVLTSINFHLKNNELTVIATDSFRLATKKIIINSDFNEIQMNVPCKSLEEFSKIIGDSNDLVDINISNNSVVFSINNLTFVSRLVEGSYPDTSSLIPNSFNLDVIFNKNELISAVDRASLFADSENLSVVKFNFSSNSSIIELSSNSNEVGRAVESLTPIQISKNFDFQVAFASKYLMDALKSFDCDNIIMHFNGEIRPAVVSGADNNDLIQLMLPVRTF